jgi:hypothetical protein
MIHNLLTGLLILFLLGGMNNCFGKFNLVREVYAINQKFNIGEPGGKINGFGKSVFMIFLGIVPVYAGAIIIDIVLLNLIEFWSDKNPLSTADNTATSGSLADGTSLQSYEENGEFHIILSKGQTTRSFLAKKEEMGVLYEKRNGKYEKIQMENIQFGSFHLVSHEGKLHALSSEGNLLF